ncbi:MAG: DUF2239 family protein [Fimbriimonas sp.]
MVSKSASTYTAFQGHRRVATGDLRDVALGVKEASVRDPGTPVLVFDDLTGRETDFDLRGTVEDVLARLPQPSEPEPRGPGRPKLGVVPREVTLLPRQWDWLNAQPGGASVALRKLVDEARRANAEKDRGREAKEATYRVMSVLAGNLPHFEEATRALYAGEALLFGALVEGWPSDVREHLQRISTPAFPA